MLMLFYVDVVVCLESDSEIEIEWRTMYKEGMKKLVLLF